MATPGKERMRRVRASRDAREAAPVAAGDLRPLADLWPDLDALAARVRSGDATSLDAARADYADLLTLARALARIADGVAAADLVQLGYVSRALIQVAAKRGRAARTLVEAESAAPQTGTHTVDVVIEDATGPEVAASPEMADD
jgi:hypothetical protein